MIFIKYFRYPLCLIYSCLVFVSLNGCAIAQKIPIKLDPNLSKKGIYTIVLMPIVDRRIDKSVGINLEIDIRKQVSQILKRKGYSVVMPGAFGDGLNITQDAVGEMGIEDLSALGPKDSEALLFIYLEDFFDKYTVMAYVVKMEATGSLIYKQERAELWRDKEISTYGQGGLISGLLSGSLKVSALEGCIDGVLVTLPKYTKAEQKTSAVNINRSSNAHSQEVGPAVIRPAI